MLAEIVPMIFVGSRPLFKLTLGEKPRSRMQNDEKQTCLTVGRL